MPTTQATTAATVIGRDGLAFQGSATKAHTVPLPSVAWPRVYLQPQPPLWTP